MIALAILVIPLVLVVIFYPALPILQLPRIGLSGSYVKTADKHVHYILALIPVVLYLRLSR